MRAINEHRRSAKYRIAEDAELYDKQLNSTINNVTRVIYTEAGMPIEDPVSSNNKIASNYFHRLNTDRVSYLLGNGISFTKHITRVENPDGTVVVHDETKERFTYDFDRDIYQVAYFGEIMGASYAYLFENDGKFDIRLFKLTEFVPLLDEYDGRLRAGIRFWSVDWKRKPIIAILYEEDGFTEYRTAKGKRGLNLELYSDKQKYTRITKTTQVRGTEVVGEENPLGTLPIIPYYAANQQSTLVGMKAAIDGFDLIMSGFCNDLQDVAQIYWLVSGALGTTDDALIKLREKLIFQHIAVVDQDNSEVKPYVNEVPYEARKVYLEQARAGIYEAFGGFDIKQILTGDRTATEIRANYTAIDNEVDAFQARVTEHLRQILKLIGVDDMPIYKRNRVENQLEQTQMIVMAAELLSKRAALKKLPFVDADEVETILQELGYEDSQRREPEDEDDSGGDAA